MEASAAIGYLGWAGELDLLQALLDQIGLSDGSLATAVRKLADLLPTDSGLNSQLRDVLPAIVQCSESSTWRIDDGDDEYVPAVIETMRTRLTCLAPLRDLATAAGRPEHAADAQITPIAATLTKSARAALAFIDRTAPQETLHDHELRVHSLVAGSAATLDVLRTCRTVMDREGSRIQAGWSEFEEWLGMPEPRAAGVLRIDDALWQMSQAAQNMAWVVATHVTRCTDLCDPTTPLPQGMPGAAPESQVTFLAQRYEMVRRAAGFLRQLDALFAEARRYLGEHAPPPLDSTPVDVVDAVFEALFAAKFPELSPESARNG